MVRGGKKQDSPVPNLHADTVCRVRAGIETKVCSGKLDGSGTTVDLPALVLAVSVTGSKAVLAGKGQSVIEQHVFLLKTTREKEDQKLTRPQWHR